jgi:hypothetical protein
MGIAHPDDRWLRPEELRAPVSPYALLLGVIEGTPVPFSCPSPGRILTFGPDALRRQVVIANLLQWPGPAVVVDLGCELEDSTADRRRGNVGPVFTFDPRNQTSACFNPLDTVRSDDPRQLQHDARELARLLITPISRLEDARFFADLETDLIAFAVARVVVSTPPEDRRMRDLLAVVTTPVDVRTVSPVLPDMHRDAQRFAAMPSRTLDVIREMAERDLRIWSDERVAAVSGRSDWGPLDLRNRKATLYVRNSPGAESALRTVVGLHLRAVLNDPRGLGHPPVLFVLEDFSTISGLPVEMLRFSYNVCMWILDTGLFQLHRLVDDDDLTRFAGGSDAVACLAPSLHNGMAQWVSERLRTVYSLDVDPQTIVEDGASGVHIVLGGRQPARVRLEAMMQAAIAPGSTAAATSHHLTTPGARVAARPEEPRLPESERGLWETAREWMAGRRRREALSHKAAQGSGQRESGRQGRR